MSAFILAISDGGKTRKQVPAWCFGQTTRVSSVPSFDGRHLAGI
jgi:hypothetical protein